MSFFWNKRCSNGYHVSLILFYLMAMVSSMSISSGKGVNVYLLIGILAVCGFGLANNVRMLLKPKHDCDLGAESDKPPIPSE